MVRSFAGLCLSGVTTAMLVGCHGVTRPPALEVPGAKTTFLFDAVEGATRRLHFEAVPDPFGGPGTVARGTAGLHGGQKLVFLNDRGFFAMPADATGRSVVIRMAVRGQRSVRIALVAKGKGFSYRATLPAEGKWCDVEVPLSSAGNRVPAGAKIVDVTLFGSDPSPGAALYVHSAVLTLRQP